MPAEADGAAGDGRYYSEKARLEAVALPRRQKRLIR